MWVSARDSCSPLESKAIIQPKQIQSRHLAANLLQEPLNESQNEEFLVA
jgi:hypothetical protein